MSVIKAFENEKQNYKANEITHVLFKTFTDITCRNRKLKQHKKQARNSAIRKGKIIS